MGRLFGTDGARGVANKDLSPELAMKIGRAAAMVLIDSEHKRPKVSIGMDTRLSGDMLESAIAAGLCSVGADVLLLGVIPTPAVAYLVKEYGYDAGVVISASHNPFEYNGIKIFKNDGFKLPDALEEEIEAIILDEVRTPPVKVGANGASSVTAEKLFQYLGCSVSVLSADPDGLNINDNCGSTHIENLQNFVRENHCDVGFAFDGDADRLIAVDENGNVVDGDKIIALCSKDMKENGNLAKDTAVVTVMSNMGFFKFAESEGIHCEKTAVGDRYVLENMLKNGYNIGGEQSGHVIFLDYATTGDGELTAIQILKAMKRSGKKLSELASVMEIYPQVLINVRVSQEGKVRFPDDVEIKKAIAHAEAELGDTGRVLVRASGTEPLIRVMLEGKDTAQIQHLGEVIAEVVRERLL